MLIMIFLLRPICLFFVWLSNLVAVLLLHSCAPSPSIKHRCQMHKSLLSCMYLQGDNAFVEQRASFYSSLGLQGERRTSVSPLASWLKYTVYCLYMRRGWESVTGGVYVDSGRQSPSCSIWSRAIWRGGFTASQLSLHAATYWALFDVFGVLFW